MKKLLSYSLCLFLISCFEKQEQAPPTVKEVFPKNSVTIMTFNVENLFDTKDAPNKKDETYLPKSLKQGASHKEKCKKIRRKGWRNQCLHWDWNQKTVETKMKRIAQVIAAVNDGQGPDLIALQEVENIDILKEMNKKFLGNRYKHILLIEGQDSRGIDNAILSRLPPIGKPRLIPIPLSRATRSGWKTDSRGILEATFSLGKEKLTLLANHFPAPFHHRSSREDGFLMLNDFAARNNHLTIAAGDFNLTFDEDNTHSVLKRLVTPNWRVSHLESCKGCQGTAYYSRTKTWSYLDMILVSKKGLAQSQWEIDKKSITVFHPMSFQNRNGKPFRFSMPQASGLSDHWPVLLTLRKGSKSSN